MDKGADPILVSLDGQRAADNGLVAVPCRNLLTDYMGRGTAGQGEGGGEEEFTEMEDVLLGLELRELVPAFKE